MKNWRKWSKPSRTSWICSCFTIIILIFTVLIGINASANYEDIPPPKMMRAFSTRNFGAYIMRFGDLNGDGQMELVLAQNKDLVPQTENLFRMITAVTAVDLNGNVLWQIGEPDPSNAMVGSDLPIVCYDINGDGKDEVILAMDFKLMILDGETGEVIKEQPTPKMGGRFERVVGDAILIANLRGLDRPSDIIFKDRYAASWAFDDQLELLWEFRGNSGHYFSEDDVTGDGRDEIMLGYHFVTPDGKELWRLRAGEHQDGVHIGRLGPGEASPVIAVAASGQGFYLLSTHGKVLKHDRIGHAQTLSVGDFLPELPGLEIAVTTKDVITRFLIYDCEGNRVVDRILEASGVVHPVPVNWTGDGRELILISRAPETGVYNGNFEKVIKFPPSVPTRFGYAIDLDGDGLDEIVLYDERVITIFTRRSGEVPEEILIQPRTIYNISNYGQYPSTNRQ